MQLSAWARRVVGMNIQEKDAIDEYNYQESRYDAKSPEQIFAELDVRFTEQQMTILNVGLAQAPLWIPSVIAGNYTSARNIAMQLLQLEIITQEIYNMIDLVLPLVR